MRTNGLVWSLAFALALAGKGQAADVIIADGAEAQSAVAQDGEEQGKIVIVSDQQAVVTDQTPACDECCEQPMCSADLDTQIFPGGMKECLIGDCCAYHLYA